MHNRLALLLLCIFCAAGINAQYTTDKVMGPKNQALEDSLKKSVYPYLFPIWGQKVVAKGFNMPKSAGLSVQYVYQQSDIIIENLQVGFNHGQMYPLDNIVRMNNAVATTNGVNIRPDIWLFPFLNVYAILAKSKSNTAIDAGIWLPSDSGSTQIASFQTKADFEANTFGFGITPTVGVKGYFLIMDVNFSWSDIPELSKPAFVFIFGPRIGKNLTFKKPNMNLALWAGGFRVQMASSTAGSLNATDLFPIDQWEQRVDNGYTKLGDAQVKVDNWWNGLTPQEQKHPANIAKHETANRLLGVYGNVLNGASEIVSGASDGSIQYSLEKRPKDKWNFVLGTQFQLNRDWMFRLEYGFLSSRTQVIAGIQYRFNL